MNFIKYVNYYYYHEINQINKKCKYNISSENVSYCKYIRYNKCIKHIMASKLIYLYYNYSR